MSSTSTTLSAGVVVVRHTSEGWRVLLLRAYNYWDFPKGVVEPGETPLATAQREVLEETGIDDLEFRWGGEFIETPPYSKNKVARYYIAVTRTVDVKLPVNPELGRAEHHEWRWLSWEEAEQRVVERLSRVLRWAQQHV
ncbi:MAG TPA: NUDIX domain-containing protein [Steroidobacteraceae bacterium]|nr:NUDIX domain-containing protein [Steroidobacteraceae bacterium]